MGKPTTKGLDGQEYELDSDSWIDQERKSKPDQIIIPFKSLGIGTRLLMGESNIIVETENQSSAFNSAVIFAMYQKDGKWILEAEEETYKEDKLKFVNNIVKEIDFAQGLANETFINILTNVFSEEKLNEILNSDDLEILLFNGLMFLKVGDKAYRL